MSPPVRAPFRPSADIVLRIHSRRNRGRHGQKTSSLILALPNASEVSPRCTDVPSSFLAVSVCSPERMTLPVHSYFGLPLPACLVHPSSITVMPSLGRLGSMPAVPDMMSPLMTDMAVLNERVSPCSGVLDLNVISVVMPFPPFMKKDSPKGDSSLPVDVVDCHAFIVRWSLYGFLGCLRLLAAAEVFDFAGDEFDHFR